MEDTTVETADRLTFWRNWYEGAAPLPNKLRLAWYDAVLAFAFKGETPNPKCGTVIGAVQFQAVSMVRATIEISRKRAENRKKKGDKSSATCLQLSDKLSASVCTNTEQEQEQEQVQVQEEEEEKEKEKEQTASSARTRGKTKPTIEQFVEGGRLAGVPEDFCLGFYRELETNGWADAKGRRVGNWRMYLRAAFSEFQEKSRGPCDREELGRKGQLDSLIDFEDVR